MRTSGPAGVLFARELDRLRRLGLTPAQARAKGQALSTPPLIRKVSLKLKVHHTKMTYTGVY